jgi:hypothetical protein
MRNFLLLRLAAAAFGLMVPSWTALGQSSLTLSSSTASAGAGSVALSLSTAGVSVSALQWTLTYPSTATNMSITAGPALTAAGKTLTCSPLAGGYNCIASGMNTTAIGSGIVANLSATVSGTSTIAVSNSLGSDPAGNAVTITGGGGSIVVAAALPTITSTACNPTTLSPGALTTCTVTLSAAAGSGGAAVTLGSTGSITVAPSLTIAAGSNTGTFTATAGQFTTTQTATVTASLNGSSSSANLSLNVAAVVSSLQCATGTLGSNASTTCTVTLSAAAPSGGAAVTIGGAIANVLTVPSTVTVAAAATTATFTAATGTLASDQIATVTASLNGSSQSFPLTLSTSVLISSVQCTAWALISNSSSTCTVTLTKAAPTGGATVTISGAITNVLTIPPSMTVSAGATTGTFTATTGTLTADQTATVTASLNGFSKTVNLVLSSSMLVSSLQCATGTLASNASTICTITLTKAAPAGGSAVTISGAIANVLTVPPSVTVAAAATTATFTASTGSVTSDQIATVTASLNGSSAPVNLTLSAPVLVSSLQCAAGALASNVSTTCTVSLTKAAPSGGATITIGGAIANLLTIPASVTVAATASTATFTASSGSIASDQIATITASLNGSSKSLSLTLSAPVLVSSLQCGTGTLTSNASTTCTVTLTKAAPSGGAAVTVRGAIANVLFFPPLVNVAAAATTATFTANTGSITSDQTATVTASLNGSSSPVNLTLSAPVLVSSLQCAAGALGSNTSTTCTVTLTKVAPSGGASVAIGGAIANLLTVPLSVTVGAAATSATFTASSGSIASDQAATITASLNGSSKSVSLALSASVLLSSLQCATGTLASNTSTTCTVTLTKIAPAGGAVVTIGGGIANLLTLPSSVTITAAATAATFTATAGTIATAQSVVVTAVYGSSSATTTLSLTVPPPPPTLSGLTCSPTSVLPGASGTCTVGLSGATASPLTVTLKSSNTGLQVPASLSIASGSGGTFAYTTSSTLTGWLIITATLGTTSKSTTLTIAAPAAPVISLSCPGPITAGGLLVCNVDIRRPSNHQATFRLSSSSRNLTPPAALAVRPGQRSIRFQAVVGDSVAAENAVVSVDSEDGTGQASIAIEPSHAPALRVTGSREVATGSNLHLQISASSGDGLPVTLSASQLPAGAGFDPETGDLTWSPQVSQGGDHRVVMHATNAFGISTSKEIAVHVGAGTPEIAGLINVAGAGAPAACVSGAAAALTGNFLTSSEGSAADRSATSLELNGAQVLVNGAAAALLFASPDRIDFVCPQPPAGSTLEIFVRTAAGLSKPLTAAMAADAPGILAVDETGSGQALAYRTGSTDIVALPNPIFTAQPAVAGEFVSLLVTGVRCEDSFQSGRPQLQLGGRVISPQTIKTAPGYAGACELTFEVPQGITSDSLPVRLYIAHYDGTLAQSNEVSIAVEGR